MHTSSTKLPFTIFNFSVALQNLTTLRHNISSGHKSNILLYDEKWPSDPDNFAGVVAQISAL
jgi:hypothetical protein